MNPTVSEISIDGYPADTPRQAVEACGPAPQLMWIPISQLVVDHAYQREISAQGRGNVRRIAAGFRWTYFSPVVVAPLSGGRYAIVDGQHRTTAAALVGHQQVPCQVIMAAPNEQAQAFTAVNGAVTRVSALAMHKAAFAAGDATALAVEGAATEAGVRILRYPVPELKQKPCETMAIGTMRECLATVGREALVLGLRSVVETEKNAVAGGLSAVIVKAVASVAAQWLARGGEPAAFIAAVGEIVLIREADKASRADRGRYGSVIAILTERLRERLGLTTTNVPGRAA
jgi:hypothetical protein